jgi:putative transposase
MCTRASCYYRHRFPGEIISHCVWFYFRFALSFRDVEEMLAIRGVALSYETIREWCSSLVRLMPPTCNAEFLGRGDRWRLDEMFLKINGRVHYLWRPVGRKLADA